MWKTIIGVPTIDVDTFITSSINLADLYMTQNRVNDVEIILRKASERLAESNTDNALAKKIRLSSNSLTLLRAWNFNMAASATAFKAGAYHSAENHLQEALAEAKRLDDKDKLATSLNNLATVYHAEKKYALAEPLYEQAKSMFAGQGPRGSQSLARLLKNYATLLRSTNRRAEAERLPSMQ